ncbi:hypothetical protein KIQ_004150 [Corynebacterium glutamicum ATCC 14067]|uniref:FAD/NAD(P)-binding protein n=1 Tax=Corynebacterium TaxID=1716 RepID=UPI0002316E9C|nr:MULTISPECIES: FAD/NAD(P)-binding protein [Corynebacterium]AST19356.1 hypothetical protein CEY17_00375 [Corynebacterium glutamicum ATCC 14067]KEI21797.1 hypothetical protein KIQ_004150 [Corynebacterium glutamicum ATCC 14067]QJS17323.1 hypothetical protein HK412_14450 [Corynebacterium glutamicum]QXU45841.1 FAD/NAD(P)-binding protein [[Brevibacterium] flavum]
MELPQDLNPGSTLAIFLTAEPDVDNISITRGRVRHAKDPLAVAAAWRARAEKDNLSIRELVIEAAARTSFVSTYKSVAEQINEFIQQRAADGFILVFVGGGPRTTGILLRLAANIPAEGAPITDIHVVDPYPAGSGRIWRTKQSGLLWMNSMAQDVTIFADDSVEMAGPVIPGPSLAEWVLGIGREQVKAAGLGEELEHFSGRSFASRRLQSLYLDWAFQEAVARLGKVTVHEALALGLDDSQTVHLDNGLKIHADTVVLTQGHLDMVKSPESAALASIAATEGLAYVPPGFTADQDLSVLPSGKPVLVRGFGLAFIDAMVLLMEGRGGTFVTVDDQLEYIASGAEPELWVGSRRGVPYLPKIGYSVPLHTEAPLYFDDDSLSAFGFVLDYCEHIFPLLTWNLQYAHYGQLLATDPSRATVPWGELSAALHRTLPPELGGSDHDISAFLESAIPDPADRFDFLKLDKPLTELHFTTQEELSDHIANYISDRIKRASDPRYSMDQAVFFTLLKIYFRVHELAETGRFTLNDLRENIDRSLHNLFSYIASGPPPIRLEQLLALNRAGLVHFLGPDIRIGIDDTHFTASSTATQGEIKATALIDAYLASDSASAVDDTLLQNLLQAGEVTVESIDGSIWGKFLVDGIGRPIRHDGTTHPSRFLLGPLVSGGGSEAPFSRPGTNARGFQRADRVARKLLDLDEELDTDIQLATASRHHD